MRDDLQDIWESVESRKWRVLESVARLPESLLRQPRNGGWSPLQIVQHLVKAEEVQLSEIDAAKKAEGVPMRNWKHRTVVWILRKGIRTPASASMLPSGEANLDALSHRWDELRGRLREAIEVSRDDRPFSINSFMGPLSADQVLELTDAHLQYHQRQLGAR